MVGLFVGIVEQWTKSAWLLMKAGPLAGKQFVVFRNPTVLGSSPKADIYLFKDEAIEPRHALIHDRGGRFEIEDMNTADGTYVNGIPVKRQILKPGDQIVLGKTVLEFALKENQVVGSLAVEQPGLMEPRHGDLVLVPAVRQEAQGTRTTRRASRRSARAAGDVTCPEPVYDAEVVETPPAERTRTL